MNKPSTPLIEKTSTLTAELNGTFCPQCKSRKHIKNGIENGNQRYKCKTCGKGFRSTTGRTLHQLHLKSKIPAYIECLNQGMSLRKAAKQIGISLDTSFRWRHKLLSALHKHQSPQLFKNITASALVLPFSNKGARKKVIKKTNTTSIFYTDCSGQTNISILGYPYQTAAPLKRLIATNQSYIPSRALPRQLKSGTPVKGSKEQVTNIHQQAIDWLNKFRGVATKYLRNYWTWFSTLQHFKISQMHNPHLLNICL